MDDPKVIEIINKLIIIHQGKKFAYFGAEDIGQEIRLICCRKIDGYQPRRAKAEGYYKGLEHWLNRVITNGLRNLYRDHMGGAIKHYKNDGEFEAEVRSQIANPLSLEDQYYYNADSVQFTEGPYGGDTMGADQLATAKYLGRQLSEECRIIMDAIASNCENISQHYRNKLLAALSDINGGLDKE